MGHRRKRTCSASAGEPHSPHSGKSHQYVMVEGPVTVNYENFDIAELAIRYLGPEIGAWYAKKNPPSSDSVVVRLRPEQWLTVDYGKTL